MASEQVPQSVNLDEFTVLLVERIDQFLDSREHPKTFCPSEVARSFSASELQKAGVSEWRELMPTIRSVVWTKKHDGDLEVLQGGHPLADDLSLDDLKGPIRIRKKQQN